MSNEIAQEQGNQQGGQTVLSSGSGSAGGNQQAQQQPSTDWRMSIPEDIRNEKSLSAIKDVGSLAKSYVEAQKMIGSTLRMPKDDSSPEEWNAFYQKLGRPERPDKYELNFPDLPTGKPWEENLVISLKETAHEAGLNTKQTQAFVDWIVERTQEAYIENQKKTADALQGFRKEWGAAFDRKIATAQRAIKEFGDAELVKFLDESGAGNHPALIRLFSSIGEVLMEDGVIPSQFAGIEGPDSAKEKIAKIQGDPKHPLWDESNPGHKAAVEEWSRLHERAYK